MGSCHDRRRINVEALVLKSGTAGLVLDESSRTSRKTSQTSLKFTMNLALLRDHCEQNAGLGIAQNRWYPECQIAVDNRRHGRVKILTISSFVLCSTTVPCDGVKIPAANRSDTSPQNYYAGVQRSDYKDRRPVSLVWILDQRFSLFADLLADGMTI